MCVTAILWIELPEPYAAVRQWRLYLIYIVQTEIINGCNTLRVLCPIIQHLYNAQADIIPYVYIAAVERFFVEGETERGHVQ